MTSNTRSTAPSTHGRRSAPRAGGVLGLIVVGLLLSGCTAARSDGATESVSASVEIGDCFSHQGDTWVPAGCDSTSDFVVFALPNTTATTADGVQADMQSLCAAAADPARLDAVTAFGPTEDSVAAGDTRITCGYENIPS
ncbi:hypothetical protein [Rathayibacter tritici]|uniref:hypothetical protein n=1 Tax=Rathayibacter tritici TaxID=33888 RepID=UPI0011B0DFD1|nr:hypothetical protein [Rathayibacter tritici]